MGSVVVGEASGRAQGKFTIEGSTRPPPESRKDSPPFEVVTIGVQHLRPI